MASPISVQIAFNGFSMFQFLGGEDFYLTGIFSLLLDEKQSVLYGKKRGEGGG